MEKQKKIVPVKVGDVLKLGVTRFGQGGDPILFYQEFVIFLQNMGRRGVELNQLVEIKIVKVLPKYAFAELNVKKEVYDDRGNR